MRRFIVVSVFLGMFFPAVLSSFPLQKVVGAAKILSIEIIRDIEAMKKSALKVFLDCQVCDLDFIKRNMTFVNFVRDRMDAEVHILVTTQATSGGGREHLIAFLGQGRFSGMQDTLKYYSKPTDTADTIRRGLLRVLMLGVIPYVLKTPIADMISVNFKEEVEPTAVEDKWDSWVFNIGLSGNAASQKSTKALSYSGDLSINRVTPASKLRLGLSANFDRRSYQIEDGDYSSFTRAERFRSLYVLSLGEHWSLGGWANFSSSTYSNLKYEFSGGPGLEYSIFPYSQSSRRILTLLYEFGYNYSKYREETIFDKLSEDLLGESLTLSAQVKEKWGNLYATLEGSHYFPGFEKNRLDLSGGFSVNLLKGLSIDVWAGYSQIHDQLSLPKMGATYEEILLQRKELATDYDFQISIGISYTFGSIFSNVVNPRFGR